MTIDSKLLYSATMSLDGFIAGIDGDMSWLAEHLASGPEVDGLVQSIGALLVGKRTFTGDDPNRGTDGEGPFGGQWQGPSFVLTHEPPPSGSFADVMFFDDLAAAVIAAKEAAAGKYVNVLGANVAKQCLDAGLLDEILVLIAPVLSATVRGSFIIPAAPTCAWSASTLGGTVRQASGSESRAEPESIARGHARHRFAQRARNTSSFRANA